jgi:hypothetical protein
LVNGTAVDGVYFTFLFFCLEIAPAQKIHNNLVGGRSVVGTHSLDDGLHDDLLGELLLGVGEDLNREISDNLLNGSLVGRDAGLLQGGDLLADEDDEDELGAGRQVITSLDTDESIGTLVSLELGDDIVDATLAGTGNLDLLSGIVVLEDGPGKGSFGLS